MKYRNRTRIPVYFDAADLTTYREAATAARLDFSAWVNSLCARAVKRDRRNPANRTHATNNSRKAKGE